MGIVGMVVGVVDCASWGKLWCGLCSQRSSNVVNLGVLWFPVAIDVNSQLNHS